MKEEFTMMGGFGNGMGSLGWLGMGVLFLLLVGLIVWLGVDHATEIDRPLALLHVERTNHHWMSICAARTAPEASPSSVVTRARWTTCAESGRRTSRGST